MMSLKNKEIKFYGKKKVCHICKKGGLQDDDKNKKKVRDHCHHTGKRSFLLVHAIQDIIHLKKFQ